MRLSDLKDKEIAIIGFGIEGQAVYRYLKSKGIEPWVLDKADRDKMVEKGVGIGERFILGQKYLLGLDKYDIIFRSPGIPFLLPELQEAINRGQTVTSQLEYFLDNTKGQTIGITGTKGKGTTATLIYEILRNDGKDVILAGNIGVPAIDALEKINEKTFVVLELSSFQLQTLKKSPHLAVVLNVTSDHLDYHESVEEYREAKKNIVRYQDGSDFAVINADYPISKSFAHGTKAKTYFFSRKPLSGGCYVDKDMIFLATDEGVVAIAKTNELLLRGTHNQENVTAAILTAYLAGATIDSIKKTVLTFCGLEHRLELVAEKKGVKFYNDSFSTVPETAIAAIKSFDQPIVLILGGSDKGSDYRELGKVIEQANIRAIIFIGDMAEKISKSVGEKYKGERIFGPKKMDEIVKTAADIAQKGDVVLLSPACASFGLFENYKDRGNQFKALVSSLG